jgi:hypothetical protein
MKTFFSLKADIELFCQGINKPEASVMPIFFMLVSRIAKANT